MEPSALRRAIHELLADHSVMTLATRRAGRPHAVSLMYASRDLALFWVSDPGTRHSEGVERDPAAAVSVARQYEDFTRIRGLQMTGRARRLAGPAADEALECLCARYDFFGPLAEAAAAGTGPLATAASYRFDPTSITYIDNTVEFGFKQTLDLEG